MSKKPFFYFFIRGGGHEQEISNAGRLKMDFTEID
jgi:hypothetical protein